MADRTHSPRKIVICGFGLIGGSIALDLQQSSRGKLDIVACDRKTVLDSIRYDGRFSARVEYDLGRAVTGADIVVLAAPHAANESLLRRLARHKRINDCLIIDTGAVKAPISALAESLEFPEGVQFQPSHPMAGKEQAGFANAERGIFRNRTWFIEEETTLSRRNRSRLDWLLRRTGAQPVYVTSRLHDDLVAELSHLPQLLSTVLGAQIDPVMLDLSGPGLKSMLRLAGSPYSVWSEIVDQNRERVIAALNLYIENLTAVRDIIKRQEDLKDVFAAAARSYKCLS